MLTSDIGFGMVLACCKEPDQRKSELKPHLRVYSVLWSWFLQALPKADALVIGVSSLVWFCKPRYILQRVATGHRLRRAAGEGECWSGYETRASLMQCSDAEDPSGHPRPAIEGQSSLEHSGRGGYELRRRYTDVAISRGLPSTGGGPLYSGSTVRGAYHRELRLRHNNLAAKVHVIMRVPHAIPHFPCLDPYRPVLSLFPTLISTPLALCLCRVLRPIVSVFASPRLGHRL